MNAHSHNSATSYFDDETSGAFYSWELTLPRGANNSILKICAIVYLFPDPVTFKFQVEGIVWVWGVAIIIIIHTSLDPLLGAPSCQRGRWRGGRVNSGCGKGHWYTEDGDMRPCVCWTESERFPLALDSSLCGCHVLHSLYPCPAPPPPFPSPPPSLPVSLQEPSTLRGCRLGVLESWVCDSTFYSRLVWQTLSWSYH